MTKQPLGLWACYLTCALAMFANGTNFAYPVLSTKLLAAGLDTSQIVITGVLIQMGYGLSSILFAAFYSRTYKRVSLAGVDRASNILACSLVLISLAILSGLLTHAEASGEPVSGPIVSLLFMIWGTGLGLTAFHSLSLVNFIFAANKAQRRVGVASMTASLGIGSVVYTLLYQFVLNYISLVDNITVLLVTYGVITAFRLIFMQRGHFQPVGSDGASHGGVVSVAKDTQTRETNERLSNLVRDVDAHTAMTAVPVSIPVEAAETAPTMWSYLKSRIVWYLSIASFFGFGVGGTYLSSVGSLAASLVDGEAEIDALTFRLTLALLCLVLVGRLVTTFVYAHANWPYMLAVWTASQFVGNLVFTASPTLAGAYASACLVGLGFGGISSVPPVVATSNFPGSVQYYSVNVAVASILMSVGPFIIGYVQTVLEEQPRIRLGGDFENANTFVYFLACSFVSAFCAGMLGNEIRKENSASTSDATTVPTPSRELTSDDL
ncbi:Hypothetical Protein FCC1311_071922 [Hondaea fermentalgiana]|uniref:Uncharacterized protein n=1 Tax=Hondaea fermentalgiana TaxID=2315210 RepID=A0A2R5GRK1_9STRA|nr:Hypothetical Protein FCC1311_071922 [Hondaea fermentalgiana]|eukprot:GBG30971.1 Hypothetical Protein FCC1311_071922 [Hondaea fermentalgiana]